MHQTVRICESGGTLAGVVRNPYALERRELSITGYFCSVLFITCYKGRLRDAMGLKQSDAKSGQNRLDTSYKAVAEMRG